MIHILYEKMAVPETCCLGKRVYKKLFYENARLGVTDKKAFREDIDHITWQYTLKPSTITIPAYEDDQREYNEMALLQVTLKTHNRTRRIAEVIHRAIPYPLVIVFYCDSRAAMSLAHKRFSQAEKGAIIAEEILLTDWIDLSEPVPAQQAFLNSLALPDLPQNHFLALYTALAERLTALNCARLTHTFRLETEPDRRKARLNRLADCHQLENRIAEHRAAVKKETRFNRQVELNLKIKSLEQQLNNLTAGL